MTALSNYLETQLITWAMSASAVTRPTAWYVALFTAAPSDTGGGTEISGGGYARQSVATWTISNNQASNAAIIDFVSSADWGNITHVGIFDAVTSGNLLWWGSLTTPRDPASGDTVRFAANALIVSLD
jgi:hypothetical protein